MKLNKFFYVGSMAVVGLSLAACSSEDELAQNPVEKGVVKTEFNISLPGRMTTRMSDAITQAQATPVFRGIEKFTLIPFVANHSTDVFKAIEKDDARFGQNIELVGNQSYLPESVYDLTTGNNSKLYKDVEVQIGTRSFLYYGEAVKSGTEAKVNGQLDATGFNENTPAGIKFSLKKIYTGEENEVCTALVKYLNQIVASCDWNEEGKALHELYATFTTLRAGSSLDVQAAVQDLYTVLLPMTDDQSKKVKDAIVKDYATADESGKLTFKDLDDYPGNIGLPDGAARLKFESNAFSVNTAEDNMNIASMNDYVYPASLWYRGNSLILVSDESKEEAYSTQDTWDNVLKQYNEGMTPGEVAAKTKSIAVKDQMQYAVARMDLYVQATATLEANEDKNGKKETINASDLKITGVLIGGQKNVDFEFKPMALTGDEKEMTIWDSQVIKNDAPATAFGEQPYIRTLVLESEEGDDAKIKFAIELQNNSTKDFMGKDGIVPAGCKFYLIGEMDADKAEKASGAAAVLNKVFQQDFFTKVMANISSLKNAYNVIPDLRAPKLELGLSVNLEWQEANTYTVTME